MSFEMGLCVGVTLGSLYVDVQGYVPVLLENLRGMSLPWNLLALGWWLALV